MNKISEWIFACVTAALLLYACDQYLIMQQNLHEAQACLAELKHTAECLSEENDTLSGYIILRRNEESGRDSKPISGEKRESSDAE